MSFFSLLPRFWIKVEFYDLILKFLFSSTVNFQLSLGYCPVGF